MVQEHATAKSAGDEHAAAGEPMRHNVALPRGRVTAAPLRPVLPEPQGVGHRQQHQVLGWELAEATPQAVPL